MNISASYLFVAVFFVLSCHGNVRGQSDPLTPQGTAGKFCDACNAGRFQDLIPLLTPKSKSTMLMSHIDATVMATKSQQDVTREFDTKWAPRIKEFVESASIDMSSSSKWTAINGLSNWPLLDKYLTELSVATQSRRVLTQPHYGVAKNFVIQDKLAKATVPLSTDGGIIAGLNGSSHERIDAGSIDIYMKNISGKWLVCHEHEYNGELEPKHLNSAK